MPSNRPTKKLKQTAHVHPSAIVARISLTSLPLEILAEILLYTSSPPTVLAVSRTCSFLYRTLSLNPAAAFIWRGVRNAYKPSLPEPAERWGKSEAEYAAFVFSSGVCEVCHKATRTMYISFAVRLRLCGSWHCRRKFINEFLVDISTDFPTQDRRSLWVPCVESERCFHRSFLASTWPNLDKILVRKTDWEKFQVDLVVYESAELARANRKGADASTSLTTDEETAELVMERCNAAVQRFHTIMEMSTELIHWKSSYDTKFSEIKVRNQRWTRDLAQREGWTLEDLLSSQAYGLLQGRKNYLLEEIESKDVSRIRSTIESQLLAMRAHRTRQKSEAAYKKKLTEVKRIYERWRCATPRKTSEPASPVVLPPLSVFYTLPSVRLLKGSPGTKANTLSGVSTSNDIKSPLATSLIISDIHAWLVPVRAHLMRLLGYSNEWQSASTRIIPPLERVTARFFCRRCGEGKVGRAYQRQLCLDLKGVCSHVCSTATRKRIEGAHQELPREDEVEDTNAGDGNGQEEGGKKSKKKRGVKTVDWVVDVFKRDDKAIRAIKTILALQRYSEEDPSTADKLASMESNIRCKTCQGWVVMDFDTAIGHAHRHESMEIEIVSWPFPKCVIYSNSIARRTDTAFPESRYAFQRGLSELLLGPSYRARNLCKKANYGCKHCFSNFYKDVSGGVVTCLKGHDGWKVMDFNGLRSHVKEKHGVRDIGDEDFFCFAPIEDGKQRPR